VMSVLNLCFNFKQLAGQNKHLSARFFAYPAGASAPG
jgi:hypothetical protein